MLQPVICSTAVHVRLFGSIKQRLCRMGIRHIHRLFVIKCCMSGVRFVARWLACARSV
jgi:hypothetical protein